jgi:hypothetical protein
MTTKTARCGCGRVQIRLDGEPTLVAACHCDFCQKRTGSAFGFQAYFSEQQCVEIVGETKIYNGLEVDGAASQAGNVIDYHFCATCGSTVYWTTTGATDDKIIGVAIGNFVDPQFRPPMREYYTKLRHAWIAAAPSAQQFNEFPSQEHRLRF